jgi:hypothetical protein
MFLPIHLNLFNMKLDKNKKIVIGVGILGLLAFILYKKGVFGGESETDEVIVDNTPLKFSPIDNTPLKSSPVIPIVMTASSSSTPQVVDLKTPPQFTEVVTANIPKTAGSFQTFN